MKSGRSRSTHGKKTARELPASSSHPQVSAETPAAGVKTPALWRRALRILARTGRAFFEDNVTRLGAALAFYTTLAVAPLLVLAIAVAGFFFEEGEARTRVIGEIQSLAGRQAREAIESLPAPTDDATSTTATVIGAVTLVFGALGVFRHLQDALNSIWRVPATKTEGWSSFLRARLFSLGTVMMTGFLLLVSLIASAVLSWAGAQTFSRLGLSVLALQIANNVISLAMITLLFALVFKLLPDIRIAWRHVWLGSVVTAFLFTVGKAALAFYLSRTQVTSAYGAAGSLVVLLLWCYYAGQIVFLGAEFTRVTALSNGGRNFSALLEPAERKRTP